MRREYMIKYRKQRGINLLQMAAECKCSRTLLDKLEASEQEVTYPNIAERVSIAYELTAEQAEGLLPPNYRKSNPDYNPDLYK